MSHNCIKCEQANIAYQALRLFRDKLRFAAMDCGEAELRITSPEEIADLLDAALKEAMQQKEPV